MPTGTVCAVWTGIGATLIAIFLLGEPRDPFSLPCLAPIVGGIVDLGASAA